MKSIEVYPPSPEKDLESSLLLPKSIPQIPGLPPPPLPRPVKKRSLLKKKFVRLEVILGTSIKSRVFYHFHERGVCVSDGVFMYDFWKIADFSVPVAELIERDSDFKIPKRMGAIECVMWNDTTIKDMYPIFDEEEEMRPDLTKEELMASTLEEYAQRYGVSPDGARNILYIVLKGSYGRPKKKEKKITGKKRKREEQSASEVEFSDDYDDEPIPETRKRKRRKKKKKKKRKRRCKKSGHRYRISKRNVNELYCRKCGKVAKLK